jgi:cbb3-type cytochrome oxidase maturation protein
MCPNCILNQAGLMPGLYVAFGICGLFFVAALVAMFWAFKAGQFDDMEEAKYEMMGDDSQGLSGNQIKNVKPGA